MYWKVTCKMRAYLQAGAYLALVLHGDSDLGEVDLFLKLYVDAGYAMKAATGSRRLVPEAAVISGNPHIAWLFYYAEVPRLRQTPFR